MGIREVQAFRMCLAVTGLFLASTQKRAKRALLFLQRDVLGTALPWLHAIESAKASRRMPVVRAPEELQYLQALSEGTRGLPLRLAMITPRLPPTPV